jgi:hypothetical protein
MMTQGSASRKDSNSFERNAGPEGACTMRIVYVEIRNFGGSRRWLGHPEGFEKLLLKAHPLRNMIDRLKKKDRIERILYYDWPQLLTAIIHGQSHAYE